uniref:Uncharacterized protein n=1 Tax=Stomoxys calcitrans TaxID=35570 RepID=A0A1I8NWF7_STOCA
MSPRSKFAIVIGIFSAIWHLLLGILLFAAGSVMDEIMEEEESGEQESPKVDPEKYAQIKEMFKEYAMGFLFLGVTVCVAMFIVSVLLVVGVKKQRPRLVAPWVYITVIAMVLQIVAVFVDADDDDSSDFMEILSCVFYAAIWFPIYLMYKKMVKAQKAPVCAPISSPVNPHYAAYVAPVAASQVPTEFSHTAKYVECETKIPIVAQQPMYPDVPAPCNFSMKV